MVAIPSRHRSLVLLTIVVVVQVLLLAVQIQHTDKEGENRSLIRSWSVGLISPFERAGAWGVGKIRGTWRHYFALSDTSRENERLKQENDALKLEITQLRGKASEADRLARLLNFRESQEHVPMVGARVIGTGPDANSAVIYLDRGQRDGIKKNMGVITPDGVVGKVIESFSDTAQVLLLTDRDSGVGAMIEESRIQSPVGGNGEPLLNMKYISNDDEVKIGEHVVTSGMDRIFPRDLPVGTIAEVKQGTPPFKLVRVRPSAQLEKLEEVIVLLTTDPVVMKKKPEDAVTTNPSSSATKDAKPKPVTGKRSQETAARNPDNSQ
ncbi:MAG TPA: rod shape-determining protein MreC [Candidatus Dormibacteraeota bacterium]|jgi:rod shape-determining protein MreC|nr:rod shape-determining protein MreC [Candidatus Dormibacteraeota bacterium]